MFFETSAKSAAESSLVKRAKDGNWMAWTLKNGIQTLPEKWTKHLTENMGATVLLNTKCTEIKISTKAEGKVQCFTNGGIIEADRVISTLPANVFAGIIRGEDSKLADMLSSIEYADMAVINLEYEKETVSQRGFGFLVPSCEPLDILGVTFDSQVFPQHSTKGSTILTVMSGGARFDELYGDPQQADPDFITEVAVKSVRDTLKIKEDPVRHICRINAKCIPQYNVGHHVLAEQIVSYVKSHDMPLTLLGNAWGGVGVNDVIVNSRNETLKWLASYHIY